MISCITLPCQPHLLFLFLLPFVLPQALAAEKEALAERWDEQNSLLVESHERVIGELTEDYEAKLAEEALRIEQLQVRPCSALIHPLDIPCQ